MSLLDWRKLGSLIENMTGKAAKLGQSLSPDHLVQEIREYLENAFLTGAESSPPDFGGGVELQSGPWDAPTGRALAAFSALAYCSEVKAGETLAPLGWQIAEGDWFQVSDLLSGVDSQAFLARKNDLAVLAFRGTKEKADWITDFNARFTEAGDYIPGFDGKVHRGFRASYGALQSVVHASISKAFAGDGRHLWITGHSLGGALAVLAAADMASGVVPAGAVTLYTYGQPRVGTRSFLDRLATLAPDAWHRVVNPT